MIKNSKAKEKHETNLSEYIIIRLKYEKYILMKMLTQDPMGVEVYYFSCYIEFIKKYLIFIFG